MPSKVTYVSRLADNSVHSRYEAAIDEFRRDLGHHYPMYIGDREILSDAGEFEKRSPINTSIIIGYFQKGGEKHGKSAIDEARKSFDTWSRIPWQERVRILRKAADLMDERKFEIAAAVTYEVGKTRLEAVAEAEEAVDATRYYAGIMEENHGYARKMGPGAQGEDCRMVCKPFGVWGVISPFNFPFMLASGMALGALITGNCVILKPTSEAPLTALMLYRVYHDAGVPPGVVNYVTGPGADFEKEFTSNHDVAGLAFTGSREVGARLHQQFLANQPYAKPVVLELGSKNPTIVTSKADLKKAAEGVTRAAFGYGGQKCSATSRVYVQSNIKAQFLEALQESTGGLIIGDPRNKDTFIGPIINETAVERFITSVEDAIKDQGNVVCGGKVLTEGDLAEGYYVEPTVVSGLPDDHRLFKEEIFLPLLVVGEFATLDEGLRKANDTDYGLTAGIFSEDRGEVDRFLDQMRFGVLYANRRGGATTGAWPGAQSFVGWRGSGATGRGVGGPYYLLNFVREQSQTVVSE
ncbi:MAG: aldehyde dehydrogenase family protein [archaeon]